MRAMHPKLQSTKEFLKVVILALVVLIILIAGGATFFAWQSQRPASCNVAVAQLYGTLVYYPAENGGSASNGAGNGTLDPTASEDIREQIEAADADPSIKAILLQVDSPGGDPVAGEDVADALKQSSKPTVA